MYAAPALTTPMWRVATYRLGRDDLAGGRIHDDGAHMSLSALRVLVPQGDGPDRLRRNALLEEPHPVLLAVEVPVVLGNLDRLLLGHVASGGPAPTRDDAREGEDHDEDCDAKPPVVPEVPRRADARGLRAAVFGRGRRHGGRGSR